MRMSLQTVVVSKEDIGHYVRKVDIRDFNVDEAMAILKTHTYGDSHITYLTELGNELQFMGYNGIGEYGITRQDIMKFKSVYVDKLVHQCVYGNTDEKLEYRDGYTEQTWLTHMVYSYERYKNFCHRLSGYGCLDGYVSRVGTILGDIDTFLYKYTHEVSKANKEVNLQLVKQVLNSKITYI